MQIYISHDIDIHSVDIDWIEDKVEETTYYDTAGQVVGRWAAGQWDPTLPFQGPSRKIASKFPDGC